MEGLKNKDYRQRELPDIILCVSWSGCVAAWGMGEEVV